VLEGEHLMAVVAPSLEADHLPAIPPTHLPTHLPTHPRPHAPTCCSYVDRMISRSFSARGSGNRLPEDVPRPGGCACCHAIDRAAA